MISIRGARRAWFRYASAAFAVVVALAVPSGAADAAGASILPSTGPETLTVTPGTTPGSVSVRGDHFTPGHTGVVGQCTLVGSVGALSCRNSSGNNLDGTPYTADDNGSFTISMQLDPAYDFLLTSGSAGFVTAPFPDWAFGRGTASSGTPQVAMVGTRFAPLSIELSGRSGSPVASQDVVFVAPATGASGTFAGFGTTVTVTTDANGVATAPPFTANAQAGNYTVTAGLTNGDDSASFALTNSIGPAYLSQYTSADASWLYIDALYLHEDASGAQHDVAMFMAYLAGIIGADNTTPPAFGSDPGSGPYAIISAYSAAEDTSLTDAATFFSSDPPTLQRVGARLLAYLVVVSRP